MHGKATGALYSVGHSNHSLQWFLHLLKQAEIEEVWDVRSKPVSLYTPHFNSACLGKSLPAEQVAYCSMGHALGGRPAELQFYDAQGYVRYDLLAQTPLFLQAVQLLQQNSCQSRIALLCSEENPLICHRTLLIGRVMQQKGMHLLHIRGDGRVQTDEELQAENPQLSLFREEEGEGAAWKSLQSALPAKTRKHSSKN